MKRALQRRFGYEWLLALVGAVLLALDAWSPRPGIGLAYLAGFGWLFSTVLGALVLLSIGYAVHVRWSAALSGLLQILTSTAACLPLLFLPVAFSLPAIYAWASHVHGNVPHQEVLANPQLLGQPWLGNGLFLARAAVYLLLWVGIAELLRRGARPANAAPLGLHRSSISAVALPLIGFSGTWATFDWLMSAIPGLSMTSLGLYVLTGGFAAALGLLAVLVHRAQRSRLLPAVVGSAHSLALGRLLFASVCLWGYLAVSQLIIVWSADLPREAAFYLPRARGSFRYLAALLVAGHLLVPFFLLLSRRWKQSSAFLAALGGWIVLMHALDLYWLVVPASNRAASVRDLGPFLLLLGVAWVLARARFTPEGVVPSEDPELARSLAYESP